MCMDSSPIPKRKETGQYENKKIKTRKNLLRVTRHWSYVTCHVSRDTCHLSLTPAATATDPTPANSPTMHSRLVRKDLKTQKI